MDDTQAVVSGMMQRCSILAESMLPPEIEPDDVPPSPEAPVAGSLALDKPQILHTRDELFVSERARSSLSNELSRCQVKLAQALEELASNTARARADHTRIIELETERDGLRERVYEKDRSVIELRSRADGQQALMQELRSQKLKLEAQVASLESQRAQSPELLACQQCESMAQETDSLRGMLRTAQSDNFKLSCELDNLRIRVESQQALINSDSSLKESLTNKIAHYEEQICELKLQLRVAEDDARQKAFEATTQLQNRLSESLQELDQARKSITSLDATTRQQAQAINELQRTSGPGETSTVNLETKLFEYRSDIVRLQKYIDGLEAHVARLIRLPEKQRNLATLLRNQKRTEDELKETQANLERLKLDYVETHNSEMTRMRQAYENELQQAQARAREQNQKLQDEVTALRKAYSDLEQHYSAHVTDKVLMECQLHNATTEAATLRENLEDSFNNAKALGQQLTAVTAEHMKLLYEFSRAKSEMEYMKGQFEKEREHAELLRQETAKQSAERDDIYLNRLPRLETQINVLEAEKGVLRDTINELEQAKRLQQHRVTSLQERITELAVTASSTMDTADKQAVFDQYIETLRHAVETTALETKELKHRLQQVELERDHLTKLVTSVDQRIAAAKKSLADENEELMTQRNNLINEQSGLKETNEGLEKQLAAADKTIEDLRGQVKHKETQLQELNTQLRDQGKKASASPETQALRKQLENMKISHMQLRKRLSERTSIAPDTMRDVLKPILTMALCDRKSFKLP